MRMNSTMQEFFSQYFGPVLLLLALAIGITVYLFRKRRFDRGYRKGTAANPQEVKRENPPDRWSRSH
jgi:uncharacterized protein HemX